MESLNTYFSENVISNMVTNLKNRLIASCIDFNKNCSDFNFVFTIKGNYIICLLTCNTGSKIMPIMYRMLTYDAINLHDIYTNGNVLGTCPYTLQTVITNTVNSVNHTAKKVTAALS